MGRPPLPLGEAGNIKLTPQPDGGWQALCRYRDRDGVTRRVKAFGPSKPKATNALREKLKRRGRHGSDVLNPDHKVSDLAEAWFLTVDKSPGTKDTYRLALDTHVLPLLGNVRLWEVSTGRVDMFLTEVTEGRQTPTGKRVGGPAAARTCKTVLRLMFAMAVRHDAVPVNPVTDMIRDVAKHKEARALTVEGFKALRARIVQWQAEGVMGPERSPDMLDKVDLLIATGVRPGELLAFRWEDVDLASVPPTVEVTGTVRQTTGSGLHRQEFPKSRTSARRIPLPVFAAVMLARRLEQHDPAENPLGLVFPSRAGTVISPGNFRRQWREARGEEFDWVTPSSFRKTVATLIDRELGSKRASEQLGHSSDAVTRKHYIERDRLVPDSTEILEQFAGRLRDGNIPITSETHAVRP
jgi:integrase